MSTSALGLDGHQTVEDYTPSHDLSLSSKTVHSDDFLNKGQDVAPPMHVSTTFRYSRSPEELKTWKEYDVCIL